MTLRAPWRADYLQPGPMSRSNHPRLSAHRPRPLGKLFAKARRGSFYRVGGRGGEGGLLLTCLSLLLLSLSLWAPLSSGDRSRHLPYMPLTVWGHLAIGLSFCESQFPASDVGVIGSLGLNKATCRHSLRNLAKGMRQLFEPHSAETSPLPSHSRGGPAEHTLGLALPC